jgi:hypothetical protein
VTDDGDYRFYPEDFDDDGELVDERDDATLAPLVIVGGLGTGLALFLADPLVDPIGVGETELALRNVSAFVFAVGLFAGSGIYLRDGNRPLGAVHALAALGWVLLGVGEMRSNDALFAVGSGALVIGAIALIVLVRRSD